jgi:hypothetical protein
MHLYEYNSFTLDQEARLRSNAGDSVYIENFLTDKEFAICRKIVMNIKKWPEHGQVSKYWGFDFNSGAGPMLTWLKGKVDDILPDWKLDFLAVQEAINPWKIHTDIRWYADKIPYKVILLPMDVEPITGPVGIEDWPETYTIAFNQRNFLAQWSDKEKEIRANVGNDQYDWERPCENIQYENLKSGYHISEQQWQEHFNHMPYNHLEGLTIDRMHQWKPKSLFHWDNTALHCADNFLSKNIKTKRSLMIFTILNE